MRKRLSVDQDYRLWVLLHHTRDVMFKAREKELRKYGITSMQAGVLFVVKTIEETATPSEIARWLLRAPHTVSGILTRMEKAGLVSKAPDLDGNGRVNISLTEKGEQVYRQSLKRESIREIMSCLPKQECKQLSLSLEKLRDEAFKNLTAADKIPFP